MRTVADGGAPLVAALFSLGKEFFDGLDVAAFERELEFLQVFDEDAQHAAEIFPITSAMSRHISGEPEAMRVVSRKPLAQTAVCSVGWVGLRT